MLLVVEITLIYESKSQNPESTLQDCAHLAQFMVDDDVDGRSFMLLNFATAQVTKFLYLHQINFSLGIL